MSPLPCAWSVVIPAFNEADRLPRYLQEVALFFEGQDSAHEIVVVDDGSADDTAGRARELARAHPAIRVERLPRNRGKGHAVRVGMLGARGALRLMADADGATPIGEVKRLAAAVEAGADVAIGSRALRDPSVAVRARRHRRIGGWLFHAAVRAVGVSGVIDTQCGFKLFRGPVADELFGAARSDGFAFDVELLLLAQRRGLRVAEVPVNWTDQRGSKVGLLRDGPGMLWQLVRLRARLGRHPRGQDSRGQDSRARMPRPR